MEGSYTGALRYPFNDGAPGLSVSGDGRGCNTLTGQFDVTEISQASTGELLVFDATFEQHCEGGDQRSTVASGSRTRRRRPM